MLTPPAYQLTLRVWHMPITTCQKVNALVLGFIDHSDSKQKHSWSRTSLSKEQGCKSVPCVNYCAASIEMIMSFILFKIIIILFTTEKILLLLPLYFTLKLMMNKSASRFHS